MPTHHDLDLDDEGNLYALRFAHRVVLHRGVPLPIRDEELVVITPRGEVKARRSIYSLFGEQVPPLRTRRMLSWLLHPGALLERLRNARAPHGELFDGPPDFFHSNSVQWIGPGHRPPFRRGTVLVCIRHLNRVALVDLQAGRVLWSWGASELQGPHHATLLPGGNVLVFDNGKKRGASRVVEVDPRTRRVVWQYSPRPPERLFTRWGGSCQRLPNGNTLISETDRGRVVEVTREGEVVWEFLAPLQDPRARKRQTIYRMTRLTEVEALPQQARGWFPSPRAPAAAGGARGAPGIRPGPAPARRAPAAGPPEATSSPQAR